MSTTGAKLELARAEAVSLKRHPDFNEAWLHDQICKTTSLLGLGELRVIERERAQERAGRLDILLSDDDPENATRFEVEVMLGPTDPSHIVRAVEYWDIERRRYPAYRHVAVLIAEQMAARYLNVLALFAGTIPLVAIQLSALRVGNQLVLNFVKVLDQRQLRTDDPAEADDAEPEVTRAAWEAKVGKALVGVCDQVAKLANEIANPKLELSYKKGRIVLRAPGSFSKMLGFFPKKNFLRVRFPINDEVDGWVSRLNDACIEAETKDGVLVRLHSTDCEQHEALLRELIHQTVREKSGD